MINVRLGVGSKKTVMQIELSTLLAVLAEKETPTGNRDLAAEVGERLCALIFNGIVAEHKGDTNGK